MAIGSIRWRGLLAPPCLNQQELTSYGYAGNGTEAAPFLVEFLPNDHDDALNLSTWKKWVINVLQATATLAVTFGSSAYSGGILDIREAFDVSQEVAILGVSLFVLGFAIGPLLWAPLSEVYGRQRIFKATFMAFTALNAGAAVAPTMAALLVLRFFAAALGSSPLTNGGGVIADMFNGSERGLASCVFAMAPFLGPAIGPIAGGFLSEAEGWRWLQGLMAIFTGTLWIIITLLVPETYAPVLLRRRAIMLSSLTGKVYISKWDVDKPPTTVQTECKTALLRPWILLIKEPIVLLTSIYVAIIYGTLFMCFAAFPIVFQAERGWSPGVGGLAFVGTAVGVMLATLAGIFENKRYARLRDKMGDVAPEARLPPAMAGSILIPLGLFWFAWTTGPTIHWIVPIAGSAFFALGLVLVFSSLLNYLIDSYVVYAASVLAANSALRSLLAAVLPLIARNMYQNLGLQWASSVPAFMALVCVPFPFLFCKYGSRIRMHCEFASEAARLLERMHKSNDAVTEDEGVIEVNAEEASMPQQQNSRCL
ncbi:Efflux pump fub11 [Fusarium solani]|nr:Efflux pump fub11 [Fusarium solani]